MPLQMTALKESVCVFVVAVLWISESLWLSLSLSSLSSPLLSQPNQTRPKKMLKKHFVFTYHILYSEANPMVRKFNT